MDSIASCVTFIACVAGILCISCLTFRQYHRLKAQKQSKISQSIIILTSAGAACFLICTLVLTQYATQQLMIHEEGIFSDPSVISWQLFIVNTLNPCGKDIVWIVLYLRLYFDLKPTRICITKVNRNITVSFLVFHSSLILCCNVISSISNQAQNDTNSFLFILTISLSMLYFVLDLIINLVLTLFVINKLMQLSSILQQNSHYDLINLSPAIATPQVPGTPVGSSTPISIPNTQNESMKAKGNGDGNGNGNNDKDPTGGINNNNNMKNKDCEVVVEKKQSDNRGKVNENRNDENENNNGNGNGNGSGNENRNAIMQSSNSKSGSESQRSLSDIGSDNEFLPKPSLPNNINATGDKKKSPSQIRSQKRAKHLGVTGIDTSGRHVIDPRNWKQGTDKEEARATRGATRGATTGGRIAKTGIARTGAVLGVVGDVGAGEITTISIQAATAATNGVPVDRSLVSKVTRYVVLSICVMISSLIILGVMIAVIVNPDIFWICYLLISFDCCLNSICVCLYFSFMKTTYDNLCCIFHGCMEAKVEKIYKGFG